MEAVADASAPHTARHTARHAAPHDERRPLTWLGLPRPTLRGRAHQVAFAVSIPAGAVLVVAARPGAPRLTALIFVLGVVGLFGVSALYHLYVREGRPSALLRRLDHSMIFVLIAASYTPFCVLAVGGPFGLALLAVVWAGALAGIAVKMTALAEHRWLGYGLYVILGWVAVVAMPWLIAGAGFVVMGLVALGGVIYTAGAIVLATHRPDPKPLVFGYHEVWHSLVVVAAVCHYTAVLLLVSG